MYWLTTLAVRRHPWSVLLQQSTTIGPAGQPHLARDNVTPQRVLSSVGVVTPVEIMEIFAP